MHRSYTAWHNARAERDARIADRIVFWVVVAATLAILLCR